MVYGSYLAQGLCSTVATNFLFILSPLLLLHFDYGISAVGVLFLTIRISSIVGSYTAQAWHKGLGVQKSAILCEILSILVFGVIFFQFELVASKLWVLAAFMGFRSYLMGVAQNTRNSWLKALDDQKAAMKVAVELSIAQQGSFLAIGALLIFFQSDAILLFRSILLFAMVLSAISMLFLIRFRIPAAFHLARKTLLMDAFSIRMSDLRVYSLILLVSFFLAVSVSGTNTLLVTLGVTYISKDFGYGLALCIYSVAFYAGAKSINRTVFGPGLDKTRIVATVLSVAMILCFVLWTKSLSWKVNSIALALFFLCYGGLYGVQESKWFEVITADRAASGFAFKDMVIGVVIASGEWLYTLAKEHEVLIRVVALVFLTASIQFLFKKRRVEA